MEYILIEQINQLNQYREKLLSSKIIAIDTETTGLDPHINKLRLIQLAIEDLPMILIDCYTFLPEGLLFLRELMKSNSIKVFQNAKFDLKFFLSINIYPPTYIFDTMIAGQILRSVGGSYKVNLEELVKYYLHENLSKEEQKSDWSNELTNEQLIYAAKDAEVLLRLRKEMIPYITQNNLVEVVRQEFSCVRAIALVEFYGIFLDINKWKKLSDEVCEKQEYYKKQIFEFIGQPKVQLGFLGDKVIDGINLDSNKQILKILNEKDIFVSNTSKHTLFEYSNNPIVHSISEYRKLTKLISLYLFSIPHQIHPITKRLHPGYAQIGAWSGRMSCGGPNIQQIPRDKKIRECFCAEEGHKLVIADYSQIELRVVAEFSNDERMIQAYINGEDLHRLTAALVSGKSTNEITKEERQSAKAMNFGLVFGMGAKGLQNYAKETYNVDMTIEEAEQFRERFFKAYKGVASWHESLKKNPPKESRTVAGRRHEYNNAGLSGLCNTPIQGSAADIIKNALGMLVERIKETNTKIVAVIHDEIVLETVNKNALIVANILKETMEEAGKMYMKRVPIVAEVQIASSWAEK